MAAGRAGRLTIGFVTHAIYQVLPRALRLLRAAHPQLDVVLREMSNAEQVDALAGGRIDIALLHPPVSFNARVNELRLGEEPMVAALPAAYEVAQDGRVSLAEIAQHGLVWFPEQQIPALRGQLLSAIRRAGHQVQVVQDANRTLTVLACVAAGLGWSLLPRSALALRHEGVRYAEVRDGAGLPAFELSAMWLARSRPTFADAFAELLAPVPQSS
jgi:DNA-binding transcriptional LysR family regulator